MTSLISFTELYNGFPAFTYGGTTGNLRSISVKVIIQIPVPVIVSVKNRPCKSLDPLFCDPLFDIFNFYLNPLSGSS